MVILMNCWKAAYGPAEKLPGFPVLGVGAGGRLILSWVLSPGIPPGSPGEDL